ncbi:PREDICTED: pyruvate dehydrogenase E1 component subunit alpha, mitochondrial-like isoform X2 [Wasmannia auropunctata]|uniref:pyruvate dehydrogenase E1 component subunit alpha, mitochondrial-like isoform X2 n=1 Tax=Wasmannia auropunctata TaxID=64793 RepID=UPI0005ED7397|nr:PREDICTED: pyruvate dehydrogenase E1 component subunit alpha, mitochondrial-like isoform X2 [Wasmannia auropunctata]
MYSIWTKSGFLFCRCGVKMRYNLLSHYRSVTKEAVVESKYDLYRLDKGPLEKSTLNVEDATYALKTMNYIRRMENRAAELYRQRLINGFLHLYVGQEAIAVGLKMALAERDTVITAYRCHGFAVVFGAPIRSVLAELMGRKTGPAKGKGGSMHMYAPRFYGGDGIVGGQVPIGTGIALAHKYNGTGAVSFTLYGDGAASQGQIYEAWNMAKLWNLPVVYICENNRYGMGTAVHRHSANTRLYTRGDLIPGIKVDGMKIVDVREAIRFSRDYALRNGPIVLEMITYRYFGHSMSDPGYSYRTREEIKAVQTEQDPIMLFTKLIVEKGLMTEKDAEDVRTSVYKEVDREVEQAKADQWPEMSEISTDVYVKPLEKIRGKVPWELL